MSIPTLAQPRPTLIDRALRIQRGRLIDCDIAVDDARQRIDRAVEEFREAVRQRDAAARHLEHLLDWSRGLDTMALECVLIMIRMPAA